MEVRSLYTLNNSTIYILRIRATCTGTAAWPPQCNSRVGGFTHTPPHQLANPPTPAVKYQEFCPPVDLRVDHSRKGKIVAPVCQAKSSRLVSARILVGDQVRLSFRPRPAIAHTHLRSLSRPPTGNYIVMARRAVPPAAAVAGAAAALAVVAGARTQGGPAPTVDQLARRWA